MKLIIASNRLPITIQENDGEFLVQPSVGGLTSSINSLVAENKLTTSWIGWPGLVVPSKNKKKIRNLLNRETSAIPVYLSEKLIKQHYEGYCNKTLWPLFHYFPSKCVYKPNYWEAYNKANKLFAKQIIEAYSPGDTIFIQDYHLMLATAMVREKLPDAKIAFFLHIPFPHSEIFRMLPSEWRMEILRGLLGADLVGFHTEEYTQYFLHNVLTILGFDNHFGLIKYGDRLVNAKASPLGIDFQEFFQAQKTKEVITQKKELNKQFSGQKVILSIDRLDYTKGIPKRLRGFRSFLKRHPEYKEKVTLLMIAVPSRTKIAAYKQMKTEIDELVSAINGELGTLEWVPIRYQYQAVHGAELKALYGLADVMLVTPLRDGMNLVAKEYVASRDSGTGVLILSEFAGAAKELREAVVVNPNMPEEISQALSEALSMSEKQQWQRLRQMQKRIKSADVTNWFESIVKDVARHTIKKKQTTRLFEYPTELRKIEQAYITSSKRLLLLDYDGTLVPYAPTPMEAKPPMEVLELLRNLSSDENNTVVIISGRDRKKMMEWLAVPGLNFIAEHGAFSRVGSKVWKSAPMDIESWKPFVMPILGKTLEKVPRSIIEEKEASVAWHFRLSDKNSVASVRSELMNELLPLVANLNVQVVWGDEAVEVKNAGVNKGVAVKELLAEREYDFILSIGDDLTDEDMFIALGKVAYRIKVGPAHTEAEFRVDDNEDVFRLLNSLMSLG